MRGTRKKRLAAVGAVSAAGVAVAVLNPFGAAVAGHENAVLETNLNGRAEVAADGKNRGIVGDPNGRGQAFVFGIDGDPQTLCYVLRVRKIGPATAAHIHEGRRGTNGPVVANLAAPADGNAADCLTEGEAGKFEGGQTVAEILEHPRRYYVNVHNERYPNGAIRGQLRPER